MSQSADAPDPETSTSDAAQGDTVSDPGMESGDSTDWSSEGGAVAEGPATDVDDEPVGDKPGEDEQGVDQPGNPTDPSNPSG